MLFLRVTLAFLLLPVSLAGIVPVWWMHGHSWAPGGRVPGLALLVLGTGLLLWCVRDFFVSGRGTLAPWDPPRELVVVGLYRFTRNPMYGAVLLIVAGWSLLYAAPSLGLYLLGLAIGFHLRVRWVEEPRLQQQFGSDWETYARHTNRWLPRGRK